MATKNDVLECPTAIRNRSDAVQLWKHLLSRGIAFHWEDDPADIIDARTGSPLLTPAEAQTIARLYDEVDALKNEWVYVAAGSLFKLTLFVGREVLAEIPLRSSTAFERCGSVEDALSALGRLASPDRPAIVRTLESHRRSQQRLDVPANLRRKRTEHSRVRVPREKLSQYREICSVFTDAIRESVGDETANSMLIALANVVPATSLRLSRTEPK